MLRFTLAMLVILPLVTGCKDNNQSADPILEKPPYDKITDSIKVAPKNAELYYHRGSMLYHNNQLLHAEQDLRKAWQLDPSEEYALSLTTILRRRNTDTAITFLQEAIKKMPESIALHIGLARGYEQKGQYDKALTITDEILKQFPNQLDALLLKSDLLKEQKKYDEALKYMEAAYTYAPLDADIGYELAYDYAEAKNNKALQLADTLIRLDPSERSARAYYIKAVYFKNIGNNTEAIKYFNESIQRDYNFLDGYLDKGILLYNLKRYPEALKSFQLGQRISPSTPDFYYWIGKTEEATGNKADAKLNYQRAYGLDRSMTEAKQAADRL